MYDKIHYKKKKKETWIARYKRMKMDPYFIVYKTLIQNGPKHETVRENIGERFMKFDLTMIP